MCEMNGQVSVQSVVNQGTEFTLTLDTVGLIPEKPDLLDKHRLQLGDRGGERRLIGQQPPAHARPTANPDPNTRTPCPTRAAPDGRPPPPAPCRPAANACSPATAWARSRAHTAANGLMPGAVMIDGVGHIGQRHTGALAGHPLGQHRRPSTRPAPGVLPETTSVLTTGSDYGGNGLGIGGLLDHHMGIGATDPERRHPGPPRPPHRRPLHGLRGNGESRRPRHWRAESAD